MKLIKMSDFVLQEHHHVSFDNEAMTAINNCKTYAQFINQELKISMFAPMPADGERFFENFVMTFLPDDPEITISHIEDKTFELIFDDSDNLFKNVWGEELVLFTIEDFIQYCDVRTHPKIELTEYATKQLR